MARILKIAVPMLVACGTTPLSAPALARQPQPRAESVPAGSGFSAPWVRMPVAIGGVVEMRPFPPRQGRKRCVAMAGIAGAQLFGDSAMELTMRNGRRYRLFFARECQALSFYQGFYYRREKAGQICAGRDAVGARSGGECAIASIIELRPPPVAAQRRPRR